MNKIFLNIYDALPSSKTHFYSLKKFPQEHNAYNLIDLQFKFECIYMCFKITERKSVRLLNLRD